MNRKYFMQGRSFYVADKTQAGNAVRDFYGSTYTIRKDGSLKTLTKKKHQTK